MKNANEIGLGSAAESDSFQYLFLFLRAVRVTLIKTERPRATTISTGVIQGESLVAPMMLLQRLST